MDGLRLVVCKNNGHLVAELNLADAPSTACPSARLGDLNCPYCPSKLRAVAITKAMATRQDCGNPVCCPVSGNG